MRLLGALLFLSFSSQVVMAVGDGPKDSPADPIHAADESHAVALPPPGSARGLGPTRSMLDDNSVSGETTTPIIDARNAGFDTLGEYEKFGNKFLEEQDRTEQASREFEKKMERIEAENKRLEELYAKKAEESREALRKLAQVPPDDKNRPAASKPRAPETIAEAPAPGPKLEKPDFSPIPNMPSFPQGTQDSGSPNYVGTQAAPEPLVANKPAFAEVPSFEGKLEDARSVKSEEPETSTIAVKVAEGKEEKSQTRLVLGKAAKLNGQGKRSLRDALKAALARKPASGESTGKGADTSESGSQQATRSALEEMRTLADGGTSAAAGGSSSSALGGYNSSGLKNEGFKMDGSETSAEVARLKSELSDDKLSAPEVLGKESADLFDRVRGAHVRSQKNGRVSLLQKN